MSQLSTILSSYFRAFSPLSLPLPPIYPAFSLFLPFLNLPHFFVIVDFLLPSSSSSFSYPRPFSSESASSRPSRCLISSQHLIHSPAFLSFPSASSSFSVSLTFLTYLCPQLVYFHSPRLWYPQGHVLSWSPGTFRCRPFVQLFDIVMIILFFLPSSFSQKTFSPFVTLLYQSSFFISFLLSLSKAFLSFVLFSVFIDLLPSAANISGRNGRPSEQFAAEVHLQRLTKAAVSLPSLTYLIT